MCKRSQQVTPNNVASVYSGRGGGGGGGGRGGGGGVSAEDEYDYARILKEAFTKHAQVLKSQCPQVVHSHSTRSLR